MAEAKTQLLAEARNDLAEKTSVAGLREAMQEPVRWIRFIFRLAIFVFSCCIIYKTYQLITEFLHSGYVNEATEVAELEILPVANVTVCAQSYFNKSFVETHIAISEKVGQSYAKETGKSVEELFGQLLTYLAFTTRSRKYDTTTLAFISKIIRQNPFLRDYSTFVEAAFPKCENMLKNCRFNGKPFDCCQRAVQSIEDDNICYILTLNHDSDNAYPVASTFHQIRPGPKGGLTLEATLDLKDIPWLEDDADNGFTVVASTVFSIAVQAPVAAPHGSETFVKVTPTKRRLSRNCAPHRHLSGGFYAYHDPLGWSCTFDKFISAVHKHVSCHAPQYLYRPNASIVCSPHAIYQAVSALSSADFLKDMSRSITKRGTITAAKLASAIEELEDDMKTAFSDNYRCPSHCQYWEYSNSASFVYLEKPGNDKNETVMFSKIHVFYGDLAYRQYEEVKKSTTYLAFCNFSNVVMLYLGMSVISFGEVPFYLVRYLRALWQSRTTRIGKAKKTKRKGIRKAKVHPEN